MPHQRERLRRYLDVSRLTLEPIAGEDGWYFASFTNPDGSMTHVLLMTDNKGKIYLPEPVSDESLPEQIDAYTSEYRLTVFIEPKSAFEIGRSVRPHWWTVVCQRVQAEPSLQDHHLRHRCFHGILSTEAPQAWGVPRLHQQQAAGTPGLPQAQERSAARKTNNGATTQSLSPPQCSRTAGNPGTGNRRLNATTPTNGVVFWFPIHTLLLQKNPYFVTLPHVQIN